MITIQLPRSMGVGAGGGTDVLVDDRCETVADALQALRRRAPAALDRVMTERGEVRPHVNIFVNDESIRFLDGLRTPVPDGSTIYVLAAVSGG